VRIECTLDTNTTGRVLSGQIPQNQIAVSWFMVGGEHASPVWRWTTYTHHFSYPIKKKYILSYEAIHDGSDHRRYKKGTGFA